MARPPPPRHPPTARAPPPPPSLWRDAPRRAPPGPGPPRPRRGRNAVSHPENQWYGALGGGGGKQGFNRGAEGAPPQKVAADLKVVVDGPSRTVTIKVPKLALERSEGKSLGDNPAGWEYDCTVCSQEGYPAPGVWRVREVSATAQQWRIGGGIDGWTDPAILDLVWPAGNKPTQEEMLGSYTPQEVPLASADPSDFALIEWVKP